MLEGYLYHDRIEALETIIELKKNGLLEDALKNFEDFCKREQSYEKRMGTRVNNLKDEAENMISKFANLNLIFRTGAIEAGERFRRNSEINNSLTQLINEAKKITTNNFKDWLKKEVSLKIEDADLLTLYKEESKQIDFFSFISQVLNERERIPALKTKQENDIRYQKTVSDLDAIREQNRILQENLNSFKIESERLAKENATLREGLEKKKEGRAYWAFLIRRERLFLILWAIVATLAVLGLLFFPRPFQPSNVPSEEKIDAERLQHILDSIKAAYLLIENKKIAFDQSNDVGNIGDSSPGGTEGQGKVEPAGPVPKEKPDSMLTFDTLKISMGKDTSTHKFPIGSVYSVFGSLPFSTWSTQYYKEGGRQKFNYELSYSVLSKDKAYIQLYVNGSPGNFSKQMISKLNLKKDTEMYCKQEIAKHTGLTLK